MGQITVNIPIRQALCDDIDYWIKCCFEKYPNALLQGFLTYMWTNIGSVMFKEKAYFLFHWEEYLKTRYKNWSPRGGK